ncbi:hypothetical protein KXD40_009288 [Peronospora effusa]|uniref:Uncharacterized protein n=1 Tax=Peronospora effusa TaxID=542832 RepID=A0A3M6VFS3_9STRA|nr:hypothetical protein DD238_006212 [Peronospora effusa]RQM12939.1 hypothetical protein DD237_005477 [Peronospora effusa]UIZ28493.1 hypothetical protein KXD40_009288 [Peronospora effusa]CAI5702554.1 unnamed protein product [Peronospora effusa]
MTDKALDITCSSTSSASFVSPSMRESLVQVSSEPTDESTALNDASIQQQSPKTLRTSGSRKRIFTFQKRWLHSLPIIERSISETEMENHAPKASCLANEVSREAAVSLTAAKKQMDVIVCMLCDDPTSKREMTKVWSRSNCRRGRIENHLMSKHPEFMRLLKHKREAEGDLPVQIFLQNLRDGRCNARTEINNGLYSQLTGLGTVAAVDYTEHPKRVRGDYVNSREDLENHRKRAKVMGACVKEKDVSVLAASVYSAESLAILRANGAACVNAASGDGVGSLTSTVLYQDAVLSAQWQTIFYNKLVVVTGADNPSMSTVATQLWLSGANVLLTFTNMSALDDFSTKHIGRFPDPSDSEDSPRGVMLPVLGYFRTQTDISEWCSSIASKYQRVDFLINYAGSEVVESISSEDANEDLMKSEPILSGAPLIAALSESMSSTCFPDRAAGEKDWLIPNNGTIVNVATLPDSTVIESHVKELAIKLQPRNVQVNCVLLPLRQVDKVVDVEAFDETATLSHSILFLLSPSSRLLSGSVLRLQQDKTLSASQDQRTDVPLSVTEAADTATEIHSI